MVCFGPPPPAIGIGIERYLSFPKFRILSSEFVGFLSFLPLMGPRAKSWLEKRDVNYNKRGPAIMFYDGRERERRSERNKLLDRAPPVSAFSLMRPRESFNGKSLWVENLKGLAIA